MDANYKFLYVDVGSADGRRFQQLNVKKTAQIIFFWDYVTARSHKALFALPHYYASKETEIMQTPQRL